MVTSMADLVAEPLPRIAQASGVSPRSGFAPPAAHRFTPERSKAIHAARKAAKAEAEAALAEAKAAKAEADPFKAKTLAFVRKQIEATSKLLADCEDAGERQKHIAGLSALELLEARLTDRPGPGNRRPTEERKTFEGWGSPERAPRTRPQE
jgi:hypothetical protein